MISLPEIVRQRLTPHRRAIVLIWLMAAAYLVAHVPFLAKTPYDLDGVNFTLALHEYDLTKHQPHPPGSPLFVGLGRAARTAMGAVLAPAVSTTGNRALDAAALAVWSAGFGALAAFGVFRLLTGLGLSISRAVLVTAVTLATPLFWFSGVRPMSDVPGLAVAVLAAALIAPWLMAAVGDAHGGSVSTTRRALLLGCFLAGLAPGMRVQMAWLIWPAAAAAVAASVRRREGIALAAMASWMFGVVLWLLPLSAIAGGPDEYLRLLRLQGSEDVAAGQMLAVSLTAGNVVRALYDSLVLPWREAWIGIVAVVAAATGAIHLAVRRPRLAAALAIIFGPYTLLHVGFHETAHVRYALPLVPLVAILAVNGFAVLGPRVGTSASLGLVAVSLALASTSVITYSRGPAPVYQALDDVTSHLTDTLEARPVLAMHHSVGLALRGEQIPLRVLPSPLRYEWLELANYWRAGGDAPVWFLASRRRTDLGLIDRYSRSLVKSFEYPRQSAALLGGARPRSVDWLEVRPPGWIALEGWSLSPEVRGVTVRKYMQNRRPQATALVRRDQYQVAFVLGGRNLGGPCATGAVVTVFLDGHQIQRFSTRAGESFVRLWRMPPGSLSGDGKFAELTVSAEDRTGAGQQVDVAFEQFDVQGAGHAVAGLDEGWFEPEYDEREGVGFRWMSERATVRVDSFERDVTVRLRGGWSLRDFRQASDIIVRSGAAVVDRRRLEANFDITVSVPAALLRANGGAIEIEASQSFVPDQRSHNGDLRVLALRILDIDVRVEDAVLRRVSAEPRQRIGAEDHKDGAP